MSPGERSTCDEYSTRAQLLLLLLLLLWKPLCPRQAQSGTGHLLASLDICCLVTIAVYL